MPTFRNTLSVPSSQASMYTNTEGSGTSAFKLQTPVNHPKESKRHSEKGENFKSRVFQLRSPIWHSIVCVSVCVCTCMCYIYIYIYIYIQGDQKVYVYLIKIPHYLAQSDCLAADRQGQRDTRFTLTPSVIPNSNYGIMVSDWNCLKYFCFFLYCNQ
jgi:hypothetical protein